MAKAIRVFQTAQETDDRLKELDALAFGPVPDYTCQWVIADPAYRFQTIEGFGGAFTEAGAVTLQKLGAAKQDEVMRAYFDPEHGHGYTLCRTHINSCDFSLGNYAYTETPGDVALRDFTIARDHQALIPMIKHAMRVRGPDLKIFASPWSPPAWMKKPSRLGGGSVEPRWYSAYARYLLAFVRAYAAEGLPIHALTVQNEPQMTHRGYPTTAWTAQAQRDFIRDHLGPLFEREGVTTRIWCWDHNWNKPEFPRTILSDPAAARFVDGTAFHHYEGDIAAQRRLHEEFPAKHIYFTEGSTFGVGGAVTIVDILRNWSRSYNFWVFLLDEHRRPNRGPHDASATCLEVLDDGSVRTNFDYFMYGQFMRHIPRGAVRVASTVPTGGPANVAFQDAAGDLVHVAVNPGRRPLRFHVVCGRRMILATLPPASIATYLWPAAD